MTNEKIKSTSSLEVNIILKLTETEARALKAITVYGAKPFLEVFYEKLGKSYLQPYEKGVISLFETIDQELPQHLKKADDARNIWRQVENKDSFKEDPLNIQIIDTKLSIRTLRILQEGFGVYTIGDIIKNKITIQDLLAVRNCGKVTRQEIINLLAEYNLELISQ
jgi:DNA-directed RNA polymerase alpha subunit